MNKVYSVLRFPSHIPRTLRTYLLLPFVHEAVEEEPEELLPVLGGVEAPVLRLLLIEADAGLVLDVAPEVNLVLRHSS